MYADEFFALLGRKHRTRENDKQKRLKGAENRTRRLWRTCCVWRGAVGSSVTLVENGGIDTVYKRGEMSHFDCSGAEVALNIFKDGGPVATLEIPIYEHKLQAALEKVGAASLDECEYECTDCRIPTAKELIDNAKDIELVKEFAQALYVMQRHTEPVIYKAILEATECGDLASAISLTREADSYVLHRQMICPSDYAKENFHRVKSSDDGVNLAAYVNMHECGRKLMEHDNAVETSYGILRRKDGAPIQNASPANDSPVMTM